MRRSSNQQVSLKPQDLVVLLKLARSEAGFTYASLAKQLYISPSEVHASFGRSRLARLITDVESEGVRVALGALRDFMLHGAQYAFPPISGSLTRGVPTAYAAPPLRDQLVMADEPLPVWPYAKGSVRGVALYPLYPSVPRAAEADRNLYEALALFDAIRIGAARERELAAAALSSFLT